MYYTNIIFFYVHSVSRHTSPTRPTMMSNNPVQVPQLAKWVPWRFQMTQYEVSEDGRVRTYYTHDQLPVSFNTCGEMVIHMSNAQHLLLKRVVAEAWHGPPQGTKCFCRHIDGNRSNVHKDNLEWFEAPKRRSN